jgi:hypothetical protein
MSSNLLISFICIFKKLLCKLLPLYFLQPKRRIEKTLRKFLIFDNAQHDKTKHNIGGNFVITCPSTLLSLALFACAFRLSLRCSTFSVATIISTSGCTPITSVTLVFAPAPRDMRFPPTTNCPRLFIKIFKKRYNINISTERNLRSTRTT